MTKKFQELESFKDYLVSRFREGVFNGKKLLSEISMQGYTGSYGTLNRYMNAVLPDYWKNHIRHNRFFANSRAKLRPIMYKRAMRFETEPGEQAQVDWGHFGKVEVNGKVEKLYCFVFVLGYSRAIYIEFTTSQKLPILQNCHVNAFKKLGIPRTIVYDNMKTVVLSREKLPDGSVKVHYNPAFLDFADYYGFDVVTAPPYWPRYKGKVEAMVKYVRNNFMQGVKFNEALVNLNSLNKQASTWVDEVANVRIHASTEEKPIVRWEKEKSYLQFPNLFRYETAHYEVRDSTKDALVQYKSNFYSLPDDFSRRRVLIKEIDRDGVNLIEIYFKDQVIAIHNLSRERRKLVQDPKHLVSKNAVNKRVRKANKDKKSGLFAANITRSMDYYRNLTPKE